MMRGFLGSAERREAGGAATAADPAGPRGNLDSPAETLLWRGPVLFGGWALAGDDPPTSVEIVVNEGRRFPALVGGDRRDVPLNLGEPQVSGACGWSALVDLSAEPVGDVRIQVVAAGATGSGVVTDRLFVLRGDGTVGTIDQPVDGGRIDGDLLVVRGWTHSVDGLAWVDAKLDGHPLGRARLGMPSPRPHAYDPRRFGPADGYELRVMTPQKADGREHELVVGVTDGEGRRAELGRVHITFSARGMATDEEVAAARLQSRTGRVLARRPDEKPFTHRDLLVFTHSLALGGGQLYLQELLRGLSPSLTRCTVVAQVGGDLSEELERLGCDLVVDWTGLPHDAATYEGAVRRLGHTIRDLGCSCVFVNTLGQWLAVDAAQRVGVPAIWAIHEGYELDDFLDLNFGAQRVPPYVRARLEATLRQASPVIFEADATRQMYVRNGLPASAALTVRYGIDVDAITDYLHRFDSAAARRRKGIAPDAVVVLVMGVFEERKGQAWLAEAFARVAAVHPRALLVMVGDHPSPYSTTVHDVIAARGLADRVRTVPITPDTWEWYGLADVFACASDIESLPRSMLEAMAFGCPVLSTEVAGIPELINDGVTGWLVRPRDFSALTAGLHRVLGLPDAVRRQAGVAGRALVRASYRSEGYVARCLELIDEVERDRWHPQPAASDDPRAPRAATMPQWPA